MTARDVSPSSAADDAVLRVPGRAVFADAQVEDAVGRVERSATLRQSPQLRRLLRHLVLHAQRDGGHALREIAVGVEALGRDPSSFDPKRDPIVRTEARRLRAKLAAYYAGEGRNDPIVIEVPKGGYVPVLRAAPPPGALGDASIAVLPFANFTGDAMREPFCDALTDELIDALARMQGLRVVARTSAFRYKDAREDVRAIGATLRVGTLLEGSVQVAGERVRVLAQLVLCTDGRHLWSQAFEGAAADLGLVQQALADEIVRSLERAGVLPHAAPSVPAPRGTRDAEARDRYDRALAILRSLDVARYPRARDLLHDALARDPGFARAHHLLALELANRVAMCALPAADGMPAARDHLRHALAIDPQFAQARALLGWIVGVYDRDWRRAEAELRRAVRDGPGNFAVRNACGNLYALFGRFEEAEAELALARELDPLHLTPRYNAAFAAFYAGRADDAIARCDAILDVEPGHAAAALRVSAEIVAGRAQAALADARKLAERHPQQVIAQARLAEALALGGRADEGRAVLAAASEALAGAGTTHWAHAHFHAVAGDVDAALAALDRACAARESNTESAAVTPYFARLRADARWPALAARHRLPAVGAAHAHA